MIKKKKNRSIALAVFALVLVLALVQGVYAYKSQSVGVAVEGSSTPTIVSPTHLDSSIYYSNNDPTKPSMLTIHRAIPLTTWLKSIQRHPKEA